MHKYGIYATGLRNAAMLVTMASVAISIAVPMTAQGRVKLVSYAQGDVIPVRLESTLASDKSQTGDRFTADVDADRRGYEYLRGATIDGVVTGVRRHTKDKPGSLSLSFTRLRSRSGKSIRIDAVAISMDKGNFQTRDDGKLVAKPGQKKQYLEFAEVGAGVGAVAGIIGGHGLRLGNVLTGAVLGAGVAQASKGKNYQRELTLKEGTKIGVLLNRPFDYKPE